MACAIGVRTAHAPVVCVPRSHMWLLWCAAVPPHTRGITWQHTQSKLLMHCCMKHDPRPFAWTYTMELEWMRVSCGCRQVEDAPTSMAEQRRRM
eukprot:11785-Eustigmatos_ZCMA.PRE.1